MFESGKFFAGANYWARHAGTAMWHRWDEKGVAGDLENMARHGLTVLRVFPLWSDFQPIHQLYGGGGHRVEMRFGEVPLSQEGPGKDGVDGVMLGRFRFLADRAREQGMGLIVGLVTGWMSGRLFVPPALEGRNPITDPVSRMWQIRFVKCFVRELKDHPAIVAWDLGNECNCMGAANREEAWNWTAGIADAIRSVDGTRPIVSGMHSLPVDPSKPWSIRDQGELTDILTTHPYPRWTPHAGLDPVGTLRTSLHAAAETRLYADLGRRPAFIEEAGTLGPSYGDDDRAAAHLRVMLASGFMENERGLLWWCGFDQDHLAEAPYDWVAVERELGLFRNDGSPKPLVAAVKDHGAFRKALPVEVLPERITDAVCILSPDVDQWAVAYAAYLTAVQAGLSLRFAWGEEDLPEAPIYFMPSIHGPRGVPRRTWERLKARVEAGAALYLSVGDGNIANLEAWAGVEIIHQNHRTAPAIWSMGEGDGGKRITTHAPLRQTLCATRAQVLAREEDGNPAFTRCPMGKGQVFFANLPHELSLGTRAGSFDPDHGASVGVLYRAVADSVAGRRLLRKKADDAVMLTEHVLDAGRRLVLCLNVSEKPVTVPVDLRVDGVGTLLADDSGRARWSQTGREGVITLDPWGKGALSFTHGKIMG